MNNENELSPIEIMWKRLRIYKGFNPDGPITPEEEKFWRMAERARKFALNCQLPNVAITFAPFWDKQHLLEKWWDKMGIVNKRFCLQVTWMDQALGTHIMGGKDWWFPYFEELGFTTDTDIDIKKIRDQIVLYRGAEPHFKNGMSWTDDLEVAAGVLHQSSYVNEPKRLYKMMVEPEHVLAIYDLSYIAGRDGSKKSREYVIDYRKIKDDDIIEFEL